ncbi:MAG: 7,8-didemethyl-8-hydroxy-5-deazariboflavin synthase subunit CofH, partial [Tritonibacter mobilis]|nr:7,8-didemethyl-8-hydroxy-5-deazariboflavin synthase subunit CofH [Tritonibacter mobilis]
MTIRQTIESPTTAVHALTDGVSAPIRQILDKALSGGEVSEAEGVSLFKTSGADAEAVYRTANELRRRTNGDHVSFVV